MRKILISQARLMVLNPVFGGSMVMILGSNMANFFGYAYHFVLGRMLGREQYGELVAFLSLLGLLSATYSFLNLVIVKFASSAEKQEQQKLFSWFVVNVRKLALVCAAVILLSTPLIANLLHLNISMTVFAAPIFFLSFLAFIYRSFLQGLLRFAKNVALSNIDLIGRLIFGAILVFLGFGVIGAVLGILISSTIVYLFGRYFLIDLKITHLEFKFKPDAKIKNYALVILVNTLAATSLYSTDILLVKHFFPAGEAGIYAAVATLGKTILFATLPVSAVMFPLISKRHANNQKYIKILLGSIVLTLGLSGLALSVFYFLPGLAVVTLYGTDFILANNYIFIYGVFITILSINTLLLSYFLSIDKNKTVGFGVFAAIIQFAGILYFHNSLFQVIWVCIISAILMLCGLLIYFAHEIRASKEKAI